MACHGLLYHKPLFITGASTGAVALIYGGGIFFVVRILRLTFRVWYGMVYVVASD